MHELDDSTEFDYDVAKMDREHAGQISLFNDLKAAIRGGADDSLVYALLNDLVEHTSFHFLSEQLAMKLLAYEAYEAHLLEHEHLTRELQNLKLSLGNATSTDKQRLVEALRSWVVVHIQTADKAFAEYVSTGANGST
jgi:hemerythrin